METNNQRNSKFLYLNNKVGHPGKGRKVKYVQTIITGGSLNNLCKPLETRTIIHYNND